MGLTNDETSSLLARRQALWALGAGSAAILAGGGSIAQAQSTFACVLASEMTEGPYWVDEKLNRSDIRVDPSDGSTRAGTPLNLTMTIHGVTSTGCALLPGAQVDIWHCDAAGLYSDVAANSTVGKKFLRGYQITNSSGVVNFTTIYPGWYRGRAIHIHVRIRTYNGTQVLGQFTTQLFFDDAVSDAAMSQAPYNTRGARDTRNSNDMVYLGASNAQRTLLTLTQTATGHATAIDVGVNLASVAATARTPYALPQLAFGGGWNTALYLANTTDAAAEVQVNFVAQNGAALGVPLTGIGSVTSQTLSLAAGATTMFEAPNDGSLTQGWAEALLPAGVIGYCVFRQSAPGRADQEAVIPLSGQSSESSDLIFDDVAFSTGLALANPTSQTVTVTLTAYAGSGARIGSGAVTLSPRAQTAVSLRGVAGLDGVAGKRGRIRITTDGGTVCAMGLRFGAEAFTSIPVTGS